MKLRLIYALVGAFVGLILAYSISAFLIGFIASTLWTNIFGGSSWPSWAGALLITFAAASFLCVLIGCIYFGFSYGRSLEGQDPKPEQKQKAFKYLFLGGIVLIVANLFSVYHVFFPQTLLINLSDEEKLINELSGHFKTISRVEVSQIEEGIEIVSFIEGPTQDKYELTLNLDGKKFIQESAYQKTIPVELKFPEQSFHFGILFKELASRYHKIAEGYVLHFQKPFMIDEVFEVQLMLSLKETPEHSRESIEEIEPITANELNVIAYDIFMPKRFL